MYACKKCGEIFDRIHCGRKKTIWGGITDVCPNCGSENIGPAIECEYCGCYAPQNKNDICPDCEKKVKEGFKKIVLEIKKDCKKTNGDLARDIAWVCNENVDDWFWEDVTDATKRL